MAVWLPFYTRSIVWDQTTLFKMWKHFNFLYFFCERRKIYLFWVQKINFNVLAHALRFYWLITTYRKEWKHFSKFRLLGGFNFLYIFSVSSIWQGLLISSCNISLLNVFLMLCIHLSMLCKQSGIIFLHEWFVFLSSILSPYNSV